ncbi:MAG: hypothetical protein RR313_03805 [Anaerovoracaceae bacterium]
MKKLYVVNICVILIIALTAGITKMPVNKEKKIKSLITNRIEILNDYYLEKYNYETAFDKLAKVEYGQLLKRDLKNFEDYKQTDIDEIVHYSIKKLNIRESGYGYLEGNTEIFWVIKDLEKEYKSKNKYEFMCQKINGKYKITKFDVKI